MKLLTYKRQLDSEQIFGFKMDDSIINIYDSSKFINEKLKDERFLSIPRSLKSALHEWDKNFLLLKELEGQSKATRSPPILCKRIRCNHSTAGS